MGDIIGYALIIVIWGGILIGGVLLYRGIRASGGESSASESSTSETIDAGVEANRAASAPLESTSVSADGSKVD